MNPYQDLPPTAFWRTGVADRPPAELVGLWQAKFSIAEGDAVSSYGSCFAQHISRALRERGFHWLDAEPAPEGCPATLASAYHHGVFSARTGNIYTPSLFNQWLGWASGELALPEEVWQHGGRFFDPFRPAIEPGGFESADELRSSRRHTLAAFRRSIVEARVVIFTLGLTERWVHRSAGHEYPMCPGTVAGGFDAGVHAFDNLGYDALRSELHAAIARLGRLAPSARLILSVSPVPMTATASGQHVLLATVRSKALLRAVAAELSALPQVDYFPSYELVSGAGCAEIFFEPNRRSVTALGVQRVMDMFIAGVAAPGAVGGLGDEPLRLPAGSPGEPKRPDRAARVPREVRPTPRGRRAPGTAREVCEEVLLDAFGPVERP